MSLLSRTKEISKKKGISIEKLADTIGVSKSGIYQWDKHEPKPSTVEKVANVLNVSTDYLLGRTDVMNISPQEQEQIDMKDMLQDNRILSFDGKPIPEKDKEQILDFIEFLKNKNGRDNE
ncbi:helix-turn-helix domain-containing protein [Dellaglioa algida]|uniref:helix-turn-helix domain-containing protein n=1 Tax=Dellaglioa algida TaxID=105612 RepID=UPI0024C4D9E7|nr:helix-turn-helix transcriptional regulator [Dellaglioa algida]MDK1726243.1 helix-turn-helix transcriptional regulator [Dellaglioa algida]